MHGLTSPAAAVRAVAAAAVAAVHEWTVDGGTEVTHRAFPSSRRFSGKYRRHTPLRFARVLRYALL